MNPYVELLGVSTDDHILCCTVELRYGRGRRIVELMWCGYEGVADAIYANDVPRAMDRLLGAIREQDAMDQEDKEVDEAMMNKHGLDIKVGQYVIVRGQAGYVVRVDEETGLVVLSGWYGYKTSTFHIRQIKCIAKEAPEYGTK